MDMISEIEDLKFANEDILKRLYTIENILLNMTDVIDMANNFEKRVKKLERKLKGRNINMEEVNQTEAPKPSPEAAMKEQVLKQALLEKAYTLYGNLIAYFKSLPVNQQSMQLAYQNLDQGIHWFEKILLTTPLNLTPVEQKNTQPVPPTGKPEPKETQQEKQCEAEKSSSEPQPAPTENAAA